MAKKSKIFGLRYLEKMTRDPALTGRYYRAARITECISNPGTGGPPDEYIESDPAGW